MDGAGLPEPPDPQPHPQDPQGELEPPEFEPPGFEPGPEVEVLEPSDPHPQPLPLLELQLHASAQEEERHAMARTSRKNFFCEPERAIVFLLLMCVCLIIEQSDL